MKPLSTLLQTICIVMVPSCVRSFHHLVGSSRNRVAFEVQTRLRHRADGACWRLLSSATGDGFDGNKKRVVFLGTPEVAASSLQSLYDESQKENCPYEIVSVITQPPRRRRRKGKLEPSPVGKVAEDLGLPVLNPEKVRPFV